MFLRPFTLICRVNKKKYFYLYNTYRKMGGLNRKLKRIKMKIFRQSLFRKKNPYFVWVKSRSTDIMLNDMG